MIALVYLTRQLCIVRCYGQSCYKYQIRNGVHVLICRDLRVRVVDGEGWSDSHMEWINTTRKRRFRERSVIFVRVISNSHENIYFREGGENTLMKIYFREGIV